MPDEVKPMARVPMRQPADWIDAWRAQADKQGLTLSEWIGQRCNEALPQQVQRGLSERVGRGRPSTMTRELIQVGGQWQATVKRNGKVLDAADFETRKQAEAWLASFEPSGNCT